MPPSPLPDPRFSGPTGPPGDPLYYLRHFEWSLNWVRQRYDDLLPARFQQFIRDFSALDEPARGLLVRLVMRKGELFRPDRLDYPELGPVERAAEPLLAGGWLEPDPELEPEALFRLFTWAELRPVCAARLSVVPSRKRDALAALGEQSPATAEDWGLPGRPVWRVTVMEQCDRLRWLFFGNGFQDWSEFVLAELGLFQYEPVRFDEQSRPLHTPEELALYWRLQQLRDDWHRERVTEPGQLTAQLPPEPVDNPWLARQYHRLLYKLGRALEREGRWPEAERLYRQCHYPDARARRLRVLERRGELREALAIAEAARTKPESEHEAQQLERILPRLRRRLTGERQPRRSVGAHDILHLTLPAQTPVEAAVAEHLSRPEAPVYHTENSLITGLLGLLCWEAIFEPLPGAFFHPFQRGPADLHWPDFYQRRRAHFDRALALLETYAYRDKILTSYRDKQPRQSPFVHWGALDETLLQQALDCLPPAHLKACFRRILADVKPNRAGLPDLVQFFPAKRGYRLIEVKGPGDRLQDNQKRWLAFFREQGIPASVCHVQWAEPEPPV